jgi:VWFA-related protein
VTAYACIAGVVVVSAGVSVAGSALRQERATFRAHTDLVSVDVSVRRGNQPVLGLTADDFRLADNGVAQVVTAVTTESVPIDVTLFHDTSPSLGGKIDALRDDVRTIAAMLRLSDRLRLLTFDLQIRDVFGWQAAGSPLMLDHVTVGQISSVYDAIFVAMMHKPDVDRRHLIVALTDCVDVGSVIGSATIEEAARRSEGVLHIVKIASRPGGTLELPIPANLTQPDIYGEKRLQSAASRTGGELHAPLLAFTNDAVKTFRKVFDDYRQSYVLRFTPTGVQREGWHEITVEVPGHRAATVRARNGYFGDAQSPQF